MQKSIKQNNFGWTVLTDPAPFSTINEASKAEDKVNWQAEDKEDEHCKAEACTLSFAAMELKNHLKEIAEKTGASGVKIKTQSLGKKLPQGNLILIGTMTSCEYFQASQKNNPFKQKFTLKGPQSFSICISRSDGHIIIGVCGYDRAGALYGTYDLLERCGIRWFSPDPWGTSYPGKLNIPLEEVDSSPGFLLRGFHVDFEGKENTLLFLWMARNRINYFIRCTKKKNARLLKKLGLFLSSPVGHVTQDRFLNSRTYGKTHPEWYCLKDGRRSLSAKGIMGDNFCISNPEARAQLAKNLVTELISGEWQDVDIVPIAPLDNGCWCSCDKCKAIGNSNDMYLLLTYDIQKSLQKARSTGHLHRNILLSYEIYHETLFEFPTKELPGDFDYKNLFLDFAPIERCYGHLFNDPKCRTNAELHILFKKWVKYSQKHKCKLAILEYYNVSSFAALPIPLMKIMASDIPFYFCNGACFMHYMHVTSGFWGTLTLTNYQFAKILWNPQIDVKKILSDFFEQYYGNSASQMKKFYEILERAMSNMKALKHYLGYIITGKGKRHRFSETLEKPDKNSPLFPLKHLQYEGKSEGVTIIEMVDLMHQCQKILDKVILSTSGDSVSKRIYADAKRFGYGWLMIRFYYHFIRLRLLERSDNKVLAKYEAEQIKKFGSLLAKVRICEWYENWDEYSYLFENGLGATWMKKAYLEVIKKYGINKEDKISNDKTVEWWE